MAQQRAHVVGDPLKLGEIRHVSYSTLDQWFKCPKAVELAKIQRAPRLPAWWFAGGSAVHAATEEYDRWTLRDPVNRPRFRIVDEFMAAFDREVTDMQTNEPDTRLWRAAGPKDAPEAYDRWAANGPVLVGNYIKWRRTVDYVIWEASDAVGIEIDLSFTPPGCDKELKAYADRIFWHPGLEQLHIIDLKTGTRGPNSPLQFGVYRAGLEALHGVVATTGTAFMNREGKTGKAFDLSLYDPRYIGILFGNLSRAIDARVFPAHKGSACRMCDVSASCYADGGALAELNDPDHPDYAPRF